MHSNKALSPAPKKILLIVLRYLGDVLMTTPMLRSLRLAYPDAQLDVLVYGCTASMLEGNPDVDHIISIPNRPKLPDYWDLLRKIFRRYDLAMAVQTGDRPFFNALLAAPFRVAVVPRKPATGWWKRYFLQRWTEFDNVNTHTVLQNLKLLDLIDVPSHFSVTPPRSNNYPQLTQRFAFLANAEPYVVLHPLPQFSYKRWTVGGWIELGQYLKGSGYKLVLSGGGEQEELEYVANIVSKLPKGTVNLAGQVSLPELTHIIAQAKLFIGPDTGTTHLATATGIPVITLFGPSNPVKWAPWPSAYQHKKNPFKNKGSQQINNVFLVQGEGECVPCHQEGCDRHRGSYSHCLDKLSPETIIKATNQALAAQK
jgi:heptosyltransferase III